MMMKKMVMMMMMMLTAVVMMMAVAVMMAVVVLFPRRVGPVECTQPSPGEDNVHGVDSLYVYGLLLIQKGICIR